MVNKSNTRCDLMMFGALGDLAQRKLFPALYQLERANLLADGSRVLAIARTETDTGGVRKQLLEKLGQVVFWKIAMKPGRPLAYGKVGNAHYFGLPGNPVSVMVTFYQFVREALLVLMGQPEPAPAPLLHVVCTEEIKKLPGRTEFQRGVLYTDQDSQWKVRPTGNQGSGILRSMSEANCFIVLDETVGNVSAGTTVQDQMLEGIIYRTEPEALAQVKLILHQ